jgi:hypothetical protein
VVLEVAAPLSLNMENVIKLSLAACHARWLKADETNILRTISVIVPRELGLQFPEDEDRDGS